MNKRSPRVLVFDSGVGGLSVASCIHRLWPEAGLVYLADNAVFPYGALPEQVVVDRCCRLIEQSQAETPCDVIVVACNTASTVVLPALRARTDRPVVGVVPAVKPAAVCSKNRKIGILATPATIHRPYLDNLIREFAPDCDIVRVGHPDLVRWAEGLVAGIEPAQEQIDQALAPLRQAGVDTVVLGCTHYPLLLPWLRASLPDVRAWVDSGDAVARRVGGLLEQAGFENLPPVSTDTHGNAGIRVSFTGSPPAEIRRFMAGLGLEVTGQGR